MGIKFPFLHTPPVSVSKNNRSALENNSFESESVDELLRNGCVFKTPSVPYVVNPLSVSINKSGKKRFILDLRKVNKFVWKEKNIFEDWKTGLEYFKKNAFCFKSDLSMGYHHLGIFPAHQTFLGFSLRGDYYCFTSLPFGLSSVPYILPKF